MFKKFTHACVILIQKYLPDPFLFAAFLTIFVFIAGIFSTHQTPIEMIGHWGNGFFGLLAFSMQMALVLVTGHTLANAPVIKRFLSRSAGIPKTPRSAIVAVTLVATVASYINWGFGLVVGALYSRELAKKIKGLDYRLLIASAYTGFVVWHAGLSASIPLSLATGGEAVQKATGGVVTEIIPTSNTLFSAYALLPFILILISMPFVNMMMHPNPEDVIEVDPALLAEPEEAKEVIHPEFADRAENSPVMSIILGVLGFAFIIHYFMTKGFNLTLDIVNMIFLFAGIILHRTPRKFLNAFSEAVKGSGGVILQFPFYAGIMGMMTGKNIDGLSLAAVMSNFFVNISTVRTFPLFSFISAGIVNFFVPSGGGQWAVQGPIMMPAAQELGVSIPKTAMAIAWGDAWTNMIQPFWALPALGIAGLGARDIMGYCLIITIYTGIIIGLSLLLLV